MTFTGRGGGTFRPRNPTPLDGAANAIEKATGGVMRARDFFPHGGAHPLCYSVAYYLKDGESLHSLTEFFTVTELREMLSQGYLLRPGHDGDALCRRALDRQWAAGDAENRLPAIRRLVDRMYPPERTLAPAQRQAVAEEQMLAVYLHAHMDEDTFDLARVVVCPDQVPDSAGRLIPACAYNLFYREQDPRFWYTGGEDFNNPNSP